jgi:CRP/FNR family cyclic AMP-dependent transcriptional regulator
VGEGRGEPAADGRLSVKLRGGGVKEALMPGGVPRQIVDMLKQVPLLSACSTKELQVIAGLGTTLDVDEGRELISQGTNGSEFFLMLDGKADCFIDGKRVSTFGPGDFFGEMALLDGGPRHATVRTVGRARVLVLQGREFSSLLDVAPSIANKMLRGVAKRYREDANLPPKLNGWSARV